jgi:hypothetical protein
MSRTADVAAVFAMLYAAHQVADHWVQTQHQASTKGHAGWRGRIACAAHIATYTATAVVALLALVWRTDIVLSLWPTVAGLTVSAVTHYIADRRTPLRWLADKTGKDPGWLERGGGLYALDQSWHVGWLAVAGLVIGG